MTRPVNGKLHNSNILISGASAAGPSLAYWLHHYGFKPTVVERSPALRAGGYAIDLRGAAVSVAERMGILDDARKASTDLREVLFVDSKNQTLATMDANFGAGPGKAGDVELLRDDLAQILYAATRDNIDYIFGDSIASLSQHDHGVDVTFERGAPRTFDLVIGADGSHSNVRGLGFGQESLFSHYLGQHVAIFTIPNYLNLDRLWLMHYVPKKMAAIMQYGSHKHTRALLMFASPKLNYDHHDTEQQKNIVRKSFAEETGWQFPRLLQEMQHASDFYFDDVSQIRMDRWSNGRVALVGDAACGPTLITGQGTSMALVGAYVLAGELASAAGDYTTAFARYENECRSYMEQNQQIALKAPEVQLPDSWEAIDRQNEMLRAMRAAPAGSPPENSTGDIIQKAANAITLKQYPRPSA
ncbi:MAG TPA: FAD-dependent monooxygenase [Candidatus Binataceae bacterium]|jgi:2-polyprenyl-6-methoxyphenol hydroxylase-like FAD-dependent oxidoreductase